MKIHTQLRIDCIHGDKESTERETLIKRFESGDLWILICTDLLARGIDFKGVKLVINYDFPNSMINYIHRVGRTGRAGTTGKAITFFTDNDKPLLRSLANVLKVYYMFKCKDIRLLSSRMDIHFTKVGQSWSQTCWKIPYQERINYRIKSIF